MCCLAATALDDQVRVYSRVSRHCGLGVARRVPVSDEMGVRRTTLAQTIDKEWVAAMRAATHSCSGCTYSVGGEHVVLRGEAVAEGIGGGRGPGNFAAGSDL
jgi:hypothetical protein